jgi:adenylosuccinate lyase
MIERYTLEEMGRVWSEQTKYEKWLRIEVLACEAQAKLGNIPGQAWKRLKRKPVLILHV